MTTSNGRFSGVIGGEEYELFLLAAPHGDDMQARTAQLVAEHCPSTEDDPTTIVELGFGTGITTQHLLRENPHAHVIGCDNEQKMLEAASQNIGDEPRSTLVLADAMSFLRGFEDGSVAVVVSGFCLHNLDDESRQAIFAEVARVLQPGGTFINLDKIGQDDHAEYQSAMDEQIAAFDVYEGIDRLDVRDEWTKHYIEDDKIMITESETRDALTNLGFSSVKYEGRVLMDIICVATK